MTVRLKVKPFDLLKIIRKTFYPQWRTMMPYESTPEDRRRAYTVGAIYVVLIILLAIMLFKIWPPVPWPWPGNVTDNDKAALAAYYTDTGCPLAKQPPPAAAPNNNQATSSTGASNSGQSGTQPTTTGGTQPGTSGGGQTGTQTTGQTRTQTTGQTGTTPAPATGATQPGTTPPPATGATQPGGQPANQTGGGGPTTTPASGGTAPQGTAQTNPQTGVTIASGEVIRIPINLKIGGYGPCLPTTFDERLLLLVIIAGMLGAFVHGATSLADYLGNNAFNRSWTWFYLLRPAIGMSLALVFYFAIRGGFLSTTGGAKDINPYGIAALAGMVGMFSKQATDKLSEVFSTLFRAAPGEGDAKRGDPLKGATVGAFQLEPPTAVAGGEAFKLTVTGTGFVNGATINVNDKPQPTTFESATKL
ncbi:MAG TPA: hypothetical protein VFT48_14115, partial [Pyrinomonadaceae bacterium]|nr:hypothetical protein [Pyrinomonadaceae bacterium]